MAVPHVRALVEFDPRHRAIVVRGEVHPGELASRGYENQNGDWMYHLMRPVDPARELIELIRQFIVLRDLGYAFLEGQEHSPAEIFRHFASMGRIFGDARFIAEE